MEAKILVVDGDQWMHGLVKSALRGEDYAITTAGDGIIALAKALSDPPELVISDVWAHRRLAGTSFMFLTGMASRASRRHGFRLGADDYLQKPFHPGELALRVASVLRRARAQGRPRPERPADLRGFSGAIEDISLASLLVLLEMERKSVPVEMVDQVRATTTHLLMEATYRLDEEERAEADSPDLDFG